MLIVPLAMPNSKPARRARFSNPPASKFRKVQSSYFSLRHPLRHGQVVVKAKLPDEL
jgi:hypothetical protein